MVKNYQISTLIISSKIKKCITIIQEIVTSCMRVIKEPIIESILFSAREFLCGVVLMKPFESLNHSFPLRIK